MVRILLDVTVDWIGTILIGLDSAFTHRGLEICGFMFVVLYGWEMITAQLRYKIGGQYSIDSGIFGPTEVRLLLAAFITVVSSAGSIQYFGYCCCLFI